MKTTTKKSKTAVRTFYRGLRVGDWVAYEVLLHGSLLRVEAEIVELIDGDTAVVRMPNGVERPKPVKALEVLR
jgi:hypothetical protein